jgi:hypothetical protein
MAVSILRCVELVSQTLFTKRKDLKALSNGQVTGCKVTTYRALFFLMALSGFPTGAGAQSWSWDTESVDKVGKFTSMAVDNSGNAHLTYTGGGGVEYAFREASSKKWFTMTLDGGDGYTKITLDQQGNPHICYTGRTLKYAHWNGTKWQIQSIASDAAPIGFGCSIGIASDGTPHLTWYRDQNEDHTLYLHLKHATLEDGAWVIRTVDFDMQTGKWNSMFMDSQGTPHISYDAFVKGLLKYATWDGKNWTVRTVDFRGHTDDAYNVGMGSSIVLDAQGQAEISYRDGESLKFARQQGETWSITTVDSVNNSVSWVGYPTSLALDQQGLPHITYDVGGTLKHAFNDGKKWHIEVIAPRSFDPVRYASLAIDKHNTIFISYRSPEDGSLKVAVGHWNQGEPRTTVTEKKDK